MGGSYHAETVAVRHESFDDTQAILLVEFSVEIIEQLLVLVHATLRQRVEIREREEGQRRSTWVYTGLERS